MILFFRQKMEDDLSQKNAWKYDIFFKCFEKMVFPKKILWKDGIFYLQIWYFFFGRKMKDDLSQEMCYKCINVTKKIRLKVIDNLAWHSRKSSNGSLYFYGDLHRRFHILLKNKTEDLIYRIEIWLLLQFIWLGDILQRRIVNTLYHSVFRSCI